jgi:hypothetical protein
MRGDRRRNRRNAVAGWKQGCFPALAVSSRTRTTCTPGRSDCSVGREAIWTDGVRADPIRQLGGASGWAATPGGNGGVRKSGAFAVPDNEAQEAPRSSGRGEAEGCIAKRASSRGRPGCRTSRSGARAGRTPAITGADRSIRYPACFPRSSTCRATPYAVRTPDHS